MSGCGGAVAFRSSVRSDSGNVILIAIMTNTAKTKNAPAGNTNGCNIFFDDPVA